MLTHKGFKLDTNTLTPTDKKKITKELTVQPEPYIGIEMPYRIYQANDKEVYLPRYYGIVNFGSNDVRTCKNIIFPGEKVQFKFTLSGFKLKPIQVEAYKYVLAAFKKYSSAILKLNCGVGKTVLGIYLIQKISRKTLVVVHRVNLLDQWKKEIEKYTDAKVGLLHRKIIDVDNKDIVLTTVHTVINKGMKYFNIYKRFCFTILDECHHLSAREFCQTLQMISTKYMLGLTATPNKGMALKINHVFKTFLGPVVPPDSAMSKFQTKNANKDNVKVNMIRYKVMDPNLSEHLIIEYAGKPNTASMVTNISSNNNRSNAIVKLIKQMIDYNVKNNKTEPRKVLIVSDRKYQLKYLHKQLVKLKIPSGLYIGGMTQRALEISKSKQVILGTYAICEEGLNIKDLNTLIVATPRRECEQVVGRILRRQHAIHALIIDIVDYFSRTFVNQSYARKKFYKHKGYHVAVKTLSDLTKLPTLDLTIDKN